MLQQAQHEGLTLSLSKGEARHFRPYTNSLVFRNSTFGLLRMV